MNNNAAIPVGFRFHPTDEELVGYYLHGKVTRNQQDQIILELDLYKIEPWDLHEVCRIGDDAPENQNNWYFFSHKDKKYPTGNRANRATAAGFWKATGRDKPIHTQHVIGMRKTLVFYKGRAPHGQKTDWIMHEFRLDEGPGAFPNFESDGWVVCRVFRKTKNFKTKSQETSASFEEEQQLSLLPELTSSPEKFSSDGGGDAGDDGGGDVDYPQSLHNMNHHHHHFTLMCAKQEISVDDYGSAVTATAVGHHPHHDHLPTFIDHHNLHHLADLQKFATSHHHQTQSHHHHPQQNQSLAPCSSSTFRTIPSISSIPSIPSTSRRQDDHNTTNNTNNNNNNYSVLPAFHNLDPASIACGEFDRASSAACNQLAAAAAAAAAQDEGAGHCSNFNPVDPFWMLPEEPRDMRFHQHPVSVQARLDQTLADVTCHVNQLKQQQPIISASTQQQINNHHQAAGLAAEHHHLTSTHEMAQLWNV